MWLNKVGEFAFDASKQKRHPPKNDKGVRFWYTSASENELGN